MKNKEELSPKERNWPLGEVQRQLNVTRSIGMGHCYFRARFLLDNIKGVYDYVLSHDRQPALIPPMTWSQNILPSPPTVLQVTHTTQGDIINWNGAIDNSDGPYLLYNIYASVDEHVDTTDPANLIATRHIARELFIPHPILQNQPLHYAVTAIDRYGNESSAIFESKPTKRGNSVLLSNDGKILRLPSTIDGTYLVVRTLQGTAVRTYKNSQQIDISWLHEGMYELISVNKKGTTHRLGYFCVKH